MQRRSGLGSISLVLPAGLVVGWVEFPWITVPLFCNRSRDSSFLFFPFLPLLGQTSILINRSIIQLLLTTQETYIKWFPAKRKNAWSGKFNGAMKASIQIVRIRRLWRGNFIDFLSALSLVLRFLFILLVSPTRRSTSSLRPSPSFAPDCRFGSSAG